MHRLRDESRWEFTRYEGPQQFLSHPVSAGAHSVEIGNQSLDLLIEDRQSTTTVVVFHSALTERESTVPVLQGHGISSHANVNLVSVADPSIGLGDIDLAWYLGNRSIGELRKHLTPLIRHAVASLGSDRLILFGASGGGYAAANFANDFPGCIALLVNPRLDLGSRPHPDMSTYLTVCHQATSRTPMLRIRRSFVKDKVADKIGPILPFDLLLFQNLGDRLYLEEQANPFINRYQGDTRLHVRMENYADGHRPIPGGMLREILTVLAKPGPRQSLFHEAGFTEASLLLERQP